MCDCNRSSVSDVCEGATFALTVFFAIMLPLGFLIEYFNGKVEPDAKAVNGVQLEVQPLPEEE